MPLLNQQNERILMLANIVEIFPVAAFHPRDMVHRQAHTALIHAYGGLMLQTARATCPVPGRQSFPCTVEPVLEVSGVR